MKSFALALRAVGTDLAMRLYVPAAIAISVVLALLVAAALWLTTLSEWWWLLFIPLVILGCVIFAVAAVVLFLIRYVRPEQTKAQKQKVKQFTDKIQNITDVVGTPKVIILFRVIRSVAAPSKSSYLSELVKNRELASDFKELQRSFDSSLVIK